jgi:hypothetical protein
MLHDAWIIRLPQVNPVAGIGRFRRVAPRQRYRSN